MATKRKYTKRPTKWSYEVMTPKESSNPFVIEEGHTYMGNRANNPYTELLAEQMLKMKADKTFSIFISSQVAANKTAAINLVLNAKRRVKDKIKSSYFATKTILSVDKKSYLGMRVWRLA